MFLFHSNLIISILFVLCGIAGCNKGTSGGLDEFDHEDHSIFLNHVEPPSAPSKPNLTPKNLKELRRKIREHFGRGTNERSNDERKILPVHEAVQNGDIKGLELLYQDPDFDINAFSELEAGGYYMLETSATAYHFAKDRKTLEWLYNHGAKLDDAFKVGIHLDIGDHKDVSVNHTPLHLAPNKGVASFFLEKGVNPIVKDLMGYSPREYLGVNEKFAKKGYMKDRTGKMTIDKKTQTELENLYREHEKKVARQIADEKTKNSSTKSAIHLAIKAGDLDLLKECLAKGQDVNELNSEKKTPMYSLIWDNSQSWAKSGKSTKEKKMALDMLRTLLFDYNADPFKLNPGDVGGYNRGGTILHAIIKAGWKEGFDLLATHPKFNQLMETVDQDGKTPLYAGVHPYGYPFQNWDLRLALVKKGAKIYQDSKEKMLGNCLAQAVAFDQKEMVRTILQKNGGILTAYINTNLGPMDDNLMGQVRSKAMVKIIQKYGKVPGGGDPIKALLKDKKGVGATGGIFRLVIHGNKQETINPEILEVFLENGYSPDSLVNVSHAKYTLLHKLIQEVGKNKKDLLSKGIQAAKVIMKFNPNLSLKNKAGKTPLQLAEQLGLTPIANVLRGR